MIKMKDSGIAWIGDIPNDWEIRKIKYISQSNLEVLPENYDTETEIKYVDIGSVTYEGGINQVQTFKFADAPSRARRVLHNGDTIISTVRTYLKAISYISDTYDKHIGSTGFSVITPSENLHKKFLYYALSSHSFISEVEANSVGISYPAITNSNLINLKIALPSLTKQYSIAEYLDEKCSKINAIIEKQQTVIEKLKEYKLSVITETITKGLNKTVDMKVLDGEWVDSIPAHWKWMSLKSVTEFITCGVAATPQYTDKESGALFLSAQNVKQGVMDYSIERYITKELHESLTKKRKPKRGDLLQVRVGASIGNVAVVDTDEEFSVYVSLTHLRCNEKIKNEFLKFCMMSPLWLQKAFSYVDFAGSQGNLNVADLRILKIPVPPINEQIDIMNYLKTKTNMIDCNIHRKEEILNRLQEYKKSLIYEVVTGKKEV